MAGNTASAESAHDHSLGPWGQVKVPRKLETLFLVSVFIPFIRIPGLSIETSLLATVASLLVLASVWHHFIRTPDSGRLLVLFVILPLAANLGLIFASQGYFATLVRMFVSLSQGFLVFFVTRNYFSTRMRAQLRNLLVLWIVVGFVQLTPLYSLTNAVFSVVFTRSMAADLDRGIQVLANEPSYAAIHLVLFIPLVSLLRLPRQRVLQVIFVILVFATRSANGILLLVGMVFFRILVYRRVKAMLGLAVVGIALVLVAPLVLEQVEGRAATIIKIVLSNPSLILTDQSISSRYTIILSNYMGWLSSPIVGTGLGSFTVTQWEIFREHSIRSYEIERVESFGGTVPYMSFIGGILNDTGIIGGLIYFAFFLWPASKCRDKETKVLLALIVFVQLQTISFSLPLPWFLLGLMSNSAFRRGEFGLPPSPRSTSKEK